MNEVGQKEGKLPFTAPKLEVYGRARDITRAAGNKGNLDNGTGASQRTHN